MSYRDILRPQLRIDEGWKRKPYRDSLGVLSIGCGRNLEGKGLRDSEIDFMLDNDIADAERDARSLVCSFDDLTPARQAVLVNMSFNLGRERLARFVNFLGAVREQRWEDAAEHMCDSVWASQVGDRAKRLAEQMRKG